MTDGMTKAMHGRPPAEPITSRRAVIGAIVAGAAAVALRPLGGLAQAAPITRAIPSSGERLPVVGLGSWITFNVGDDPELRDECAAVIRAFFRDGGRMIDSSPMYGSSQAVIGYGLTQVGRPSDLFSADKVWISSRCTISWPGKNTSLPSWP
jgi:hypothetical protein